jgi:hypothetical protein
VRLLAVGIPFTLLVACSDRPPTVVDGSSPAAFNKSIADARRDLPDADRLVFDRAIKTIGGRRLAERDTDALARVTFDGMTATEIVADQKSRDQ